MVRNMKKQRGENIFGLNRAIVRSFFLVLIVMLTSFSMVSAFEFDNIKQVPDRFSRYEDTITIRNSLVLIPTTKIAEIKLLENTDQALFNGRMRFSVKLFKHYEGIITDTTFKDRNGADAEVIGDWYYYNDTSYVEEINNYTTKCVDGKNLGNGTIEQDCTETITKINVNRNYNKWEKYNGEDFQAGDYIFEYRGKKIGLKDIDIIPHLFGVELNEYAWWDSNWTKKKAIDITENNNTVLNNYSILLNITYESSMNNNFSDLRFVNSTDDSEINYWIQKKVDGDFAEVWVKFPLVQANTNTTFYIYYGNDEAVTTSNFEDSFVYGDDFEDDSSANWEQTSCDGGFTVSGGIFTLTETSGGAGISCRARPKVAFQLLSTDYEVESKSYTDSTCVYLSASAGYMNYASNFYYRSVGIIGLNDFQLSKITGTGAGKQIDLGTVGTSYSLNTNYTHTLALYGNALENATRTGDGLATIIINSSDATYTSGNYGMGQYEGCGVSHSSFTDWFRVRPIVISEPSYSLGVEKQNAQGGVITVLTEPNDATTFEIDTITFNSTTTPINSATSNLTNGTVYIWYSNDTLLGTTTITLSGNETNLSGIEVSSLPVATGLQWNVLGCGKNSSTDFCSFATSNYTLNLNPFIENSITYNNNTREGSTETFKLNLTLHGAVTFNDVVFVYNNTNYSSSIISNGLERIFTSTVDIPNVPSEKNVTFYWALNLNLGMENSTKNNQTISPISIDDCSSFSEVLLNMTLKDEDSQYFLNGTTNTTQIKIDLELFRLGSTTAIISLNKTYDIINSALVCLNEINDSTYTMNSIISYESVGRFKEFYHIQNFTLNNATMFQNISFYNLNSSLGQEFKITYKDENFRTVPNAIVQIQRKYIDEGTFKVVEIPKISSAGYTIAHLIRNDIIYNLIIIKNGVVLDSFNNIVANCQNPAITQCEININSFGSVVSTEDFSNDGEFTATLTYDRDTRLISSTYAIVSGTSTTTSLNVTLFDALGNTSVCSDSIFAAGGTLSCTVPEGFGNTTVAIKLISAGDVKREAIFSLKQDPNDIYGSSLVFIGMMLLFLLIGMGTTENPMFLGIMLIIGTVLLFGLNILFTVGWFGPGATILWLVIAIVLLLIKAGNRQ